MILFSAFLFLFTNPTYFRIGVPQGSDIEGQDFGNYTKDGEQRPIPFRITSSSFAWDFILGGGGIVVLAGLAAIFTKNVVWFGAGAIMAVIFGLWNAVSSNIGTLFIEYPLANALWTIFTIGFGFIATIAVVEMFTGRSSDD